MSTTVEIRGKQIATAHITLVEPFDPAKNTAIPNPQRFAGRVRLVDGTSLLIEQSPADFGRAHGFRVLGVPDNIATNPAVVYRVETFDLTEAQKRNPDFKPERKFASRLSWGKSDSVLLQNDADTVASVVLKGQPDRSPRKAQKASGPARPAPRG